MAGFSMELVLAIGYAVFLAIVAFVLEMIARHMHQRSLQISTVGFTYHADRDIWSCPRDQHLFPIFSDVNHGKVIYRAPASACNSCRSKAACTDSTTGREITRMSNESIDSGILRFHRCFSLTLLALAGLIVIVELLRTQAPHPRLLLAGMLLLLFVAGRRLSATIRVSTPPGGGAGGSRESMRRVGD